MFTDPKSCQFYLYEMAKQKKRVFTRQQFKKDKVIAIMLGNNTQYQVSYNQTTKVLHVLMEIVKENNMFSYLEFGLCLENKLQNVIYHKSNYYSHFQFKWIIYFIKLDLNLWKSIYVFLN